MAAGMTQITVLDGTGTSRTVNVWSSNGLITGNLSFIQSVGVPYQATPMGYQQITSLTSAQSLTVPSGSAFCYVTVEGTNVRWRDDGTAPTASVGMPIYAGQAPLLFSGDLSVVKFIQVSASATLNVAYYS
jgi:hypothetical protein